MTTLPPGQHPVSRPLRFGLPWRVGRVPKIAEEPTLVIRGDVRNELTLDARDLGDVKEQISDLHCVTTWSALGLEWRGVRFRDLYETVIATRAEPARDATVVFIHAADGYVARLPLEDALSGDVLLATHLGGEPLTLTHGAPLRFVAPAHYGYKNVKHVTAISFHDEGVPVPLSGPSVMEHPRGRVEHEERGRLPAWLLRLAYRPLIPLTAYLARRALR